MMKKHRELRKGLLKTAALLLSASMVMSFTAFPALAAEPEAGADQGYTVESVMGQTKTDEKAAVKDEASVAEKSASEAADVVDTSDDADKESNKQKVSATAESGTEQTVKQDSTRFKTNQKSSQAADERKTTAKSKGKTVRRAPSKDQRDQNKLGKDWFDNTVIPIAKYATVEKDQKVKVDDSGKAIEAGTCTGTLKVNVPASVMFDWLGSHLDDVVYDGFWGIGRTTVRAFYPHGDGYQIIGGVVLEANFPEGTVLGDAVVNNESPAFGSYSVHQGTYSITNGLSYSGASNADCIFLKFTDQNFEGIYNTYKSNPSAVISISIPYSYEVKKGDDISKIGNVTVQGQTWSHVTRFLKPAYIYTDEFNALILETEESQVTPKTHNITVFEAENGTITADKTSAKEGESVTLSAKPNEEFELDGLTVTDASGNNVELSGNTFEMPASDVTVTATFKAISHKVAVKTPENGTVSADKETAAKGEKVTLKIEPEEGFALDSLTVKDASGKDVAVNDNNIFEMPASDVTISASFKALEYKVAVAGEAEKGTVTADKTTAKKGDAVTLTATPDEGYNFVGWEVKTKDGKNVSVATHLQAKAKSFSIIRRLPAAAKSTIGTFIMPASDVTYTALFSTIPTVSSKDGKLDGDMLVNGDTEHSAVYVANKKKAMTVTGSLDVSPIKTQLKQIQDQYQNGKAATDILIQDGAETTFTAVMTLPNELVFTDDVKAELTGDNGNFKITGTKVEGKTITVTMTAVKDFKTFQDVVDTVTDAGDELKVNVTGVKFAKEAKADTNYTMTGSLTGNFKATAEIAQTGSLMNFDLAWTAEQKEGHEDAIAQGTKNISATVKYLGPVNVKNTGKLSGDMLVNNDTEHDAVYTANKSETMTVTGALDVSPIKTQLAQIQKQYQNGKAATDILIQDGAETTFTAVMTLPEGLEFTDDVKAELTGDNGNFKITGTKVEGQTVTVTMAAAKTFATFQDVVDTVTGAGDELKVNVTGVKFAKEAKADTNYTMTGSLTGNFNATAESAQTGREMNFDLAWSADQEEGKEDAIKEKGTKDITVTVKYHEKPVTPSEPEPITVSDPPVQEIVKGDTPKTYPTFSFNISPVSTTADGLTASTMPMPDKMSVSVTGAGSAEFGNITFRKAGTYVYKITEDAGSENGWTYDKSEYTVTYIVAKSADGKTLTAARTIKKDGAAADDVTFTNSYKIVPVTPVTVDGLSVKKIVNGKKLAEYPDFHFVIKAVKTSADGLTASEMPMPSKKTITVNGKGSAKFGDITFEKAGTYIYRITEMNGGEKDWTYDDSEYTVIYVVAKSEDGTSLTAKRTIEKDGAAADDVTFTNAYTKTEPNKKKGGSSNPKTGDDSSLPLAVAVLGASVVALAFVIARRKRESK
ncbi:MAG: FctA domain-containing protein [Eubacteriales bacterium]|nr:FctA domain-containing protein [Eubacteriales bacterium]